MTAAGVPVGKLVVRTFLWLVPCFAAWYLVAPYHATVAGWLARVWIDMFSSGTVTGLEREGMNLVFVTGMVVHPAPGQDAVLLPEVNPLLYTYGLALFVALMLAARAGWRQVLVGIAILLPFQAWGIAFDFLVQVGIKLGPVIAARAGVQGWRVEAVALGYQVGTLLLPSVVPVVLWAIYTRPFVLKAAEGTS